VVVAVVVVVAAGVVVVVLCRVVPIAVIAAVALRAGCLRVDRGDGRGGERAGRDRRGWGRGVRDRRDDGRDESWSGGRSRSRNRRRRWNRKLRGPGLLGDRAMPTLQRERR